MIWRPKKKVPESGPLSSTGSSLFVEVQAEEGTSFLQFLWMISFGRYTRCITAPDENLKCDMLPLNPLAIFHTVTAAIIEALCSEGYQFYTMTDFPSSFEGAIIIPSEIWADFAEMITRHEDDITDSAGRVPRQAPELIEDGSVAFNTNSDVSETVVISETSESFTAKPQNKYIQKMILSEKMPIDTACLLRSTRSTRYDGFKMTLITDAKKTQSKVKPRGAPSVACSSKATDPCSKLLLQPPTVQTDELPPPTPIQQLQHVGTVLCGILAEELSTQKLLASDQVDKPELH